MIEYVQKLWREPSDENLSRVMKEWWRAENIIINYNFLLTQISEEWRLESNSESVKNIYLCIEHEEELIKECKEVANKIEEALKAKK